jgi:hypothetical protein
MNFNIKLNSILLISIFSLSINLKETNLPTVIKSPKGKLIKFKTDGEKYKLQCSQNGN